MIVRSVRQTARSRCAKEIVSIPKTFRVRFRFRLQKKLSIAAKERQLNIDGHEIVLSAQLPDSDIADSDWLVMNARGFESEYSAAKFAQKLKTASEISSVAARLGIDTGTNQPTSGFGKAIKDRVRETDGVLLRDNVHGVDVFPDDPAVRIGHFSAIGTVRASPDPFLVDLNELFKVIDGASQRTRDIALLLNYALMRPEPVAQIVFAISQLRWLVKMNTGVPIKSVCWMKLRLRPRNLRSGLTTSGVRWYQQFAGYIQTQFSGKVCLGSFPRWDSNI